MLAPHWLERGLTLAETVASWSKDPSSKVGACILRPDKSIASVGFNGFPSWEPDDERLSDRAAKYPIIVHAESNAIRYAREDISTYTICVTLPPCETCAYEIIRHRLAAVVVRQRTWDTLPERWFRSALQGRAKLVQAGIEYILHPEA